MKFVAGTMKLHAVFLSIPNNLFVSNTSCFCQNYSGTSFKPETACDGYRIVALLRKRNPSILSSSEKAVEIRENELDTVPDKNNHVAAVMIGRLILAKCLRSMILMLKSHFMNMLELYQ